MYRGTCTRQHYWLIKGQASASSPISAWRDSCDVIYCQAKFVLPPIATRLADPFHPGVHLKSPVSIRGRQTNAL